MPEIRRNANGSIDPPPIRESPIERDLSWYGEYAILTNLIHQEWSGVSVKARKDLKGLQTQNLRDQMSEAELLFTALLPVNSTG